MKGYQYKYTLEQAFGSKLSPIYHAKSIIVPAKSSLRVYAAKSKVLIREVKLDEKKFGKIVGVALLSKDNQIIVASLSGNFNLLNSNTFQVELEFKINSGQLLSVHTAPSAPGSFYVGFKVNEIHQILLISKNLNLPATSKAQKHASYEPLKKDAWNLLNVFDFNSPVTFVVHSSIPNCVVVSQKTIESRLKFIFYMLNFFEDKIDILDFKNDVTSFKFRTMALHPLDSMIAIGNSNSEICLFKWSRSPKGQLVINKHPELKSWHSSGVKALCFTPDGQNLLSGSDEDSLVSWRLGNSKNVVLPRLRGSICSITCSPDQLRYALRHNDGSVSLVNSVNMQLGGEIISLVPTPSSFVPKYDTNTGALVLSGPKGLVNLLNLSTRVMHELEIQPELNRVFDELYSPSVSVAAVGNKQLAFASTLKCNRAHLDDSMEPSLKFFALNQTTNKYTLYAEIRNAHSAPIADLKFTGTDQLVSLSWDGVMKIWLRDSISNNGNEEYGWACSLTHRFEVVPSNFQFSYDRSTVVLNYGNKLALLDGTNLTWIQYLADPTAGEILEAHFLPNTTYLVALTSSNVLVFSLVTSLLAFKFPIGSGKSLKPLLIIHIDGHFSVTNVIDKDNKGSLFQLLTFDPQVSEPVAMAPLSFLPNHLLRIDHPAHQASSCLEDLLLLDSDNSIHIYSAQPNSASTYKAEKEVIPVASGDKPSTESQYEHHSLVELNGSSAPPALGLHLGDQFNTNLKLESHVAPPVSALLTDFILAAMKPSARTLRNDTDSTNLGLLDKLELQLKEEESLISQLQDSSSNLTKQQVLNDLNIFETSLTLSL